MSVYSIVYVQDKCVVADRARTCQAAAARGAEARRKCIHRPCVVEHMSNRTVPYIDRSRVLVNTEQHFGCSVPEGDDLASHWSEGMSKLPCQSKVCDLDSSVSVVEKIGHFQVSDRQFESNRAHRWTMYWS